VTGEAIEGELFLPFFVEGEAVVGGLGGEVIVEPVEVASVVLDPEGEAVGFGYEDAALFVDGEGGG
jgi:hypothetical protein